MRRLSEREAAARLEEIERSFDLYGLKLDGWVPWRTVRSVAGLALTGFAVDVQRKASTRASWLSLMVEVPILLWSLVFARRRTLLIKTYTSALGERENNKLRDIYFDSLIADGLDAFKVQQQNSAREIRRHDMLHPFQISQTAIAALARVLALLRVRASTFRVARRIAHALQSLPELKLDEVWLARRLESIRWQARLYERLLARVRPRAVLVADAGEYALNIASKRRAVPFIELQHGIFTENHPDAIPGWALEKATPSELLLPDVLGVYGRYWAQRLQGTAVARQRIVIVGSDVLDRWRQRRRRLARQGTSRLEVVVTTQGLERGPLIDWLARVVACAPTAQSWRMVIKLHPIYDRDPALYASLTEHPAVEVLGHGSNASLYDLLVGADVHASISSASHYDSIGLGVPSVIIPLPGSELVIDLADGHTVFKGDDPAIVWACAMNARRASASPNEKFYAEGFVQRLRSALP